ncbi:hypothetical protein Taro_019493 [Colocasia esculenta]|uniref:Transmembrane protein n=1 Tax=Colocasia esculenta TaxID=4460 RepID=A0A843UU18_COLES|nr:hypothetical protein [Colocasia esculenta]
MDTHPSVRCGEGSRLVGVGDAQITEMGSTEFSRGILVLSLVVVVLASGLGGTDARASHFEAGGRTLLQVQNDAQVPRTLARTKRVDPLDGFKKYRGGYNITNKHYWSSTIFTGIHGYSIALLWLLGGMLYVAILLLTPLCCTSKRERKPKTHPCTRCCPWPLPIGIVLFTVLAIIASGVALAGSSRFHARARSVKNIIDETAQRASATIYNVTGAVRSMQNDTELYGSVGGPTGLDSASRRLDDEATRIQRKAQRNMRMISRGLKILQVTTVVMVSVNLVAILLLLGAGFLRLKRPFHMLLVLLWVLTFLCWAYFGLYFFLDRQVVFAGDTCAAFDEYEQDPRSSSLGTILPCNDQLSATRVLRDTRAGIYGFIQQANANISSLRSSFLPQVGYICNPFSPPPDYTYQPESCSASEIRIGDVPQVLRRYTCSNTNGGICGEGEFISASQYTRVQAYTTSVQNLLNSFPGVERLVSCQLLKDAFNDILSRDCRPLRRYAHTAWAAMAALSTVMVLLALTWVTVAHCDGKHASSDVNPHLHKNTSPPDADINKVENDRLGLQSEA